jgi:signal transduction histidine kinase
MADPGASELLRDTSASLSDLVVIMAHDLKNALAALSANLHFLEGAIESTADADSLEALSDSVTLCHVLDQFLRNLDLIGRSDTEKLTVHRNFTSLRAVAGDVVGKFQRQAKAAGVELATTTDGQRDVLAFVDRELFARAAENLVMQAIEHAPKGSRVTIDTASEGAESSLTVIDARESPPPSLDMPAPTKGGSLRPPAGGKAARGLGLYCAAVAGRAAGGRLEPSGGPGNCRLRLVAPARQ